MSDAPAVYFAAELLTAYPNAKIILSMRENPEKWLESMKSTLWHSYTHLPPLPPDAVGEGRSSHNSATMRMLSTTSMRVNYGDDIPGRGKEVYEKHNAEVKKLAKEQGRPVLEYIPGDGWERICEFLGKVVPRDDEGKVLPFPRQDDWAEYKKAIEEKEKATKAET